MIPKENQMVKADFTLAEEGFTITFSDPSYVRAEEVVINADRSVGVVLHETYHDINFLPQDIDIIDIIGSKQACLSACLPDGKVFTLKTNIRILS